MVPARRSAKAKTGLCCGYFGERVLRREIQVLVHEVERWRKEFLDGGASRLKKRGGDPEERALHHAQAKVGDLTLKLELTERLTLNRPGSSGELVT